MNNDTIGVIIINYNGASDTNDCISSISKSIGVNIIIYVVDNNSTQEDRKLLNRSYNNVKFILLDENYGFGIGNNIGIDRAISDGCEYILLINNDTIVEEDAIIKMYEHIKKNNRIGILGCTINYYDDKQKHWYYYGKILKNLGTAKNIGKAKEYGLNFVSGCCMLTRADIISKIGMFSEDYFLYYEDTDLCMRMINNGFLVEMDKDALIYHKVGQSTVHMSDIYLYYIIRNRYLFIHKNINGVSKLVAYIYSFASMLYKLLRYRRIAILCGFFDFIRGKVGKNE